MLVLGPETPNKAVPQLPPPQKKPDRKQIASYGPFSPK
jgi:hypothetical protein